MTPSLVANTSPEANIIERMQVDFGPRLYVLDSFEKRVTFYNQQVRALNLIHALRHGRFPPAAPIAVIGAGAGACPCSRTGSSTQYSGKKSHPPSQD
jgi:hypothetical protein